MLLALDTATPAVTVAVADGDHVLAERTSVDARRHGELLVPAVAAVLAAAGVQRSALTAVGVGVGPGPYTGLRVGLVTARTLGAVLGIPVLGVCTLDVLALGAVLHTDLAASLARVGGRTDAQFRVVTDARRREVHWAAYRPGRGGPQRVEGPHVSTPDAAGWDGPAVGAGAARYADAFPGHRGPTHPAAGDLARWVARGLGTVAPEPMYLRRPDAAEPAPRTPVR